MPDITTIEESDTQVLEADPEIQQDTPWHVMVYDDPVNLMTYVTKVLQQVFGYSADKASILMMEVHNAGESIVWTGGREKAELYVQQLQGFQLRASLRKAEGRD